MLDMSRQMLAEWIRNHQDYVSEKQSIRDPIVILLAKYKGRLAHNG